jgi:serine protease Do
MKKSFLFLALNLMAQFIMAQDLADLFDATKRSVVTIYIEETQNPGTGNPLQFASNTGLGSGVLVSESLVLTAAHVVANAEDIKVQFFDGESLPARTLRVSRIADVAVIQLEKPPKKPEIASIGNSDHARVGEDIYIIGAPLGLPYSLSRGVISGRHSEEKMSSNGKILEFLQTDASINTGNSGGPMFNMKGEVIGIVSSILTRSGGFEGIGFAATTEIARTLLSQRSSRYFGVEAMVLPYELARALNVPQESGWLIQHVVQDSPAGNIGLRGGFIRASLMEDEEEILLGGDIILQVDDIRITGPQSFHELIDYMDGIKSVHTFRIRVLRAGEIREFSWITNE